MRISHRFKFVFISNPKCATESIRGVLDQYSDILSCENYSHIFFHHTSAYRLKQYFEAHGWDWNDYFKFGTIRNPWDRVISHYFFSRPDAAGHNKFDPRYNPIAFNPFLAWLYSDEMACLRSQNYFCDWESFPTHKMLIDRIIKVEELNKEMRRVCRIVGVPDTFLPMPRYNVTDHKPYAHYYRDETRARVAELFQFDIQLGGYQFGQ